MAHLTIPINPSETSPLVVQAPITNMTRENPLRRSRHELGSSWVVEGDENKESMDGGDDERIESSAQSKICLGRADEAPDPNLPRASPPRPRTPPNRTWESSEPELVMPSIHQDDMVGSWVAANSRSPIKQIRRRTPKSVASANGRPTRSSSNSLRSSTPKTPQRDNPESKLDDFTDTVGKILRPMLEWAFDIAGGALRALKKPISYALAIYLFFGLMLFLRNILTSSIYSALSPICRLPGSYLLDLQMCHSPVSVNYKGEKTPPVEFDQLMTAQSKFEDILEQSAGGVSLPLDMKRGETSIRDLRQVVRYSQLRSKIELELEFDGFIETARIASYDLQRFNSHVGRGVDNILATARWTKRVLNGIALRDESRGALQSFISDKILAPFQPLKFTEDAVLDQYIQHTRIVEEEIQRLISEAQALLSVLQNLEDRLDVIHDIATRDNVQVQGSKEEILSQLWTILGGNRNKLGKYETQLRLLQHVGEYRRSAWAHVSGTILKLQAMGAELEELRERVGSAELLRDRTYMPLSVHIENIQLGVERLEVGRNHAKGVENEYLRKILDRGGVDEKLIGSR